MSKKAIDTNHEEFERNIEDIINYGSEIIKDNSKRIDNQKSMLLESLLLKSTALWENFVSQDLIYLVHLDSMCLKDKMELSQGTKLDLSLIRALLFADSYRNYYNINDSRGYFKEVLTPQYNLFAEITSEQGRKINAVYKIRNYLSHYSAYARKQLLKVYQEQFRYRRFLEPGMFLMKHNGKYFERLMHNFAMVSTRMRRKLREEQS
ncbi:MAG: hypothetical protein V1709_06715 [Planctomycetota bacterium]